jgi:hypothetical protein
MLIVRGCADWRGRATDTLKHGSLRHVCVTSSSEPHAQSVPLHLQYCFGVVHNIRCALHCASLVRSIEHLPALKSGKLWHYFLQRKPGNCPVCIQVGTISRFIRLHIIDRHYHFPYTSAQNNFSLRHLLRLQFSSNSTSITTYLLRSYHQLTLRCGNKPVSGTAQQRTLLRVTERQLHTRPLKYSSSRIRSRDSSPRTLSGDLSGRVDITTSSEVGEVGVRGVCANERGPVNPISMMQNNNNASTIERRDTYQ